MPIGRSGQIVWFPFEALIGGLMISTGGRDLFGSGFLVTGMAGRVSAISYLVGGILILLGLWRLWIRVEYAGLLLLVIGITFSTVTDVGLGVFHWPDFVVLWMVWLASLTRLYSLTRGRVVMMLQAGDDDDA